MPTSNVPEPWYSAMERVNIGNPRNGQPSIRALAERAGVAPETVRRMIRGDGVADPENTVPAVAEALRLSPVTVSKWVGQARTIREPYAPPGDANLLSRDERKAIDEMIRLLAASKRGAERDEGPENTVTPLLRAAHKRGKATPTRPSRRR